MITDGLTLAEILAREATDEEMATDACMMADLTAAAMEHCGHWGEQVVTATVVRLVEKLPRDLRLKLARPPARGLAGNVLSPCMANGHH